MTMKTNAIDLLRTSVAAGLLGAIFATPAQAQCTASIGATIFATIQAAINSAGGGTIRVGGTCNEDVNVNESKHNITLDGSRAGPGTRAIINSAVPTNATVLLAGSTITFTNFVVNGGASAGILVSRGGSALISNNVVQGARSGININNSSTARISNNLVQNNLHHGILVQENSSARIGYNNTDDTVASGNVIQNNGRNGIQITTSASAGVVGNNINGNGENGVEVSRGSHAALSANSIEANALNGIFARGNSGVDLGDGQGNTPLFDLPNETSVDNGEKGVACNAGGYVSGKRGTLNGARGPMGMGQGCVNQIQP